MLNLIKKLCKIKDFQKEGIIENFLECQTHGNKISFDDLISYIHPQTADNILHYSARCGNLKLICEIKNRMNEENLQDIFNKSNKDGKNALHEVFEL